MWDEYEYEMFFNFSSFFIYLFWFRFHAQLVWINQAFLTHEGNDVSDSAIQRMTIKYFGPTFIVIANFFFFGWIKLKMKTDPSSYLSLNVSNLA